MSINVAVLGIGDHARRNTLPALAECESIKLVGISSRNKIIAEQEAQRYRCKVYEDGNEILADKNIDVVYIALPIGLHAQWGLMTIQSGKHLWCEKSLTHDPVLTQKLINEAKKNELGVSECFMYAHHPQFERLKQFMQGQQIGTVRSITARFGFPHFAADDIRYDNELGGGALLDAGCYLLHAARQLAGSIPEHINSILVSEENYIVDTGGAALLGFASGLQANLQWGFGHSYVNEIELWGEHGQVKATRAFSKPASHEPGINILYADGNSENILIPACNHFVAMFSYFADACMDVKLRQILLEDAEQQALVMEQIRNN